MPTSSWPLICRELASLKRIWTHPSPRLLISTCQRLVRKQIGYHSNPRSFLLERSVSEILGVHWGKHLLWIMSCNISQDDSLKFKIDIHKAKCSKKNPAHWFHGWDHNICSTIGLAQSHLVCNLSPKLQSRRKRRCPKASKKLLRSWPSHIRNSATS